jgi:hypothetical protein
MKSDLYHIEINSNNIMLRYSNLSRNDSVPLGGKEKNCSMQCRMQYHFNAWLTY